jgi:hypothetical protein
LGGPEEIDDLLVGQDGVRGGALREEGEAEGNKENGEKSGTANEMWAGEHIARILRWMVRRFAVLDI